jgi:hypothetical protein
MEAPDLDLDLLRLCGSLLPRR